MKKMAARFIITICTSVLAGLFTLTPVRALPAMTLPTERLGGVAPGISTVPDAVRTYGEYDLRVSGEAAYYVGADEATHAYLWSPGLSISRQGLVLETPINSPVVSLVMVNLYPGIGTSRGLTTLVPEQRAVELYGMPDYAYELSFNGTRYRELYFLDEGLYVLLGVMQGRPNWTITKLVVTYPNYLRNAVARRAQAALVTRDVVVEDITYSYRVWVRLAVPPA